MRQRHSKQSTVDRASAVGRKVSGPNRALAQASNDVEKSARALWKGAIAFGLVQIPVSIATAENPHELAFHQLDRRDDAPVGYDRVNKLTGKKVQWADIVKGYEISKGKYVVVTDEDFKKANVGASQTIEIQDFVRAAEIPPAYFERPYHLIPGGKSPKAYAVLRDAMLKKGLVAVALVVVRTRQHLCAVIPRDGGLDLEILRFAHELRESRPKIPSSKATARETQLAESLIEQMVTRWEPEKYRDSYRDDLLSAIHEKARTGVIEPRNVPVATAPVTDLVALLEKSMAAKPNTARKGKAPGKPRAA